MTVVKDHWFRADYTNDPCKYTSCGRTQAEHVESVGEWSTKGHHFFRPSLHRPSFCGRCDRRWGHSNHIGSRRNRSLHWNRWNAFWGWYPHPRCNHKSRLLGLRCLRFQVYDGLCGRHYGVYFTE